MNKPKYSQILKAIEPLSFSIDQQINYLKNLGTYPSADELALEFDDAFQRYKGMISEGMLEEFSDISFQLGEIDNILNAMSESGNPDLWSVQALQSPHWNQ